MQPYTGIFLILLREQEQFVSCLGIVIELGTCGMVPFSATIMEHEPSLPVQGVFLSLPLGVDVVSDGLEFFLYTALG